MISEIDRKQQRAALYAKKVAAAYYRSNPRVTLIDVGWKIKDGVYTGDLAVRVHVRKKPTDAQFALLSEVKPQWVIDKSKIPYPVVDIVEANYPLHLFWWDPQPPDPRAGIFNPLKGGISISGEWLFGYGTLGGFVQDRDTHEPMILSNWHVLAGSEYAGPGTRIFQPGYGDYGSGQDTVARLVRHAFGQGVDAAVAKLTGARSWANDELEIGPATGVQAPSLGMQVTKSGRVSGVTHGVIDGVEGEYSLYYGATLRTIQYVNRIVPQPGYTEVSRPGDSGSLWMEEGSRQAVGLHFAGQNEPEAALAMALPEVLDALNVDLITTPQQAVPAPAEIIQPVELVGG